VPPGRRTRRNSAIDEIVDFAGLERFLDTPIKRFSWGMWLRLAFAVAAHVDPDVLLVDEVLAVGDVRFREKRPFDVRRVVSSDHTPRSDEVVLEGESAAAVREERPSLVKMFWRCRATVCSLITSAVAISLLLWPVATRRSTSSSRAVSPCVSRFSARS
jgi:hypothetical protein